MEDQKIVELYFNRNESALSLTKEKYGNRLRSAALGIVKDEHTAEECENDTYMQAWCSIPPKDPREHLYAFLLCIIRRLALDRCRKSSALKRRGHITELSSELEQCLPSSYNVEDSIDNKMLSQVINSFLASLTPEKRRVFVRRYFFLDSISEIAGRFGISEEKVKITLFRCRNELKKQLEKEGVPL